MKKPITNMGLFTSLFLYLDMGVIINGREVSPCICSKAKFVLGLTTRPPINRKTCSNEYWADVVVYYGSIYSVGSSL